MEDIKQDIDLGTLKNDLSAMDRTDKLAMLGGMMVDSGKVDIEAVRNMCIDDDMFKDGFEAIVDSLAEEDTPTEEETVETIDLLLDSDKSLELLSFMLYTSKVTNEDIRDFGAPSIIMDTDNIINTVTQLEFNIKEDIYTPDKHDALELMYGIENYRQGYTLKVLDVLNNNPLLKHSELLGVYKEKLDKSDLESLEEEFIRLLTLDNLGTKPILLKLISELFEDNNSEEEDSINLNILFFNNLLQTLIDRLDIEKQDDFTKYLCGILQVNKES